MSPRPRKVSDDDVFAATHRAMSRLGPGELTLAEIAAEAGVTAGALVQRFGSKRDLLLSLFRQTAGSARQMMGTLRARYTSPLAALRGYATCMADLAQSPAAFLRNLAYLQIDLADPDFRACLVQQARATRAALREWVAEAVAAGELDADATTLARTIETVVSGSLITWATYRQASAARWIQADVDAVLAPYLATRSGPAGAPARHGSDGSPAAARRRSR
jgi:AcrR family transcriptional regulator